MNNEFEASNIEILSQFSCETWPKSKEFKETIPQICGKVTDLNMIDTQQQTQETTKTQNLESSFFQDQDQLAANSVTYVSGQEAPPKTTKPLEDHVFIK